jgi:putative PEP-CTERM system TPR-repeat lipoprotein
VALAYVAFLQSQGAPMEERTRVLARLMKSQPGSVRGRLALVGMLIEAGQAQSALAAAQEGIAADPGNPALLRALGAAQLEAGNYTQAVDSFSKLAGLLPQSPMPQMLLAFTHVKAGDNRRALEALDRALKIKPDFLQAQFAAARLHFRLGDNDAAARIARDIQRQQPTSPYGYALEADLLRAQKRLAEADQVLKNGLAHASVTTLAVKRYSVLSESGKTRQAKEFAAEWLATNPNDAVFRVALAEHALASKEYAEAFNQYRAALGKAPNDAVLLNNVAWAAHQAGDPRALDYAERANELRPGTPAIMDTLGWILVEKGDVKRGLTLLRQAVELAPAALPIRVNLAKALMRAGEKNAAKRELDYLSENAKDEQTKAEVEALARQL